MVSRKGRLVAGVAGSLGRHTGRGSVGRRMGGMACFKETQKEAQIVVTLKNKRSAPPTADVAPSDDVATWMQSRDSSSSLGVPKSWKPKVSPRGHFRPLSQEDVVFRAMRVGEAE